MNESPGYNLRMSPEITPAVSRALAAAQALAEALGHQRADSHHLLLALLDEEDGKPRLLLEEQDVPFATVHERLRGQLAQGPDGIAPQDLLFAARRIALDLAGESTVSSDHLLLALVRQDSLTRHVLEELGFSVEKLEARLRVLEASPIELDEPLRLVEATEQLDIARILDANANRAREALRVVEDYCRFVLDDAFLSGETKRLRHELAGAMSQLPPRLLLEARDTQHDVGVPLRTASEEQRASLQAVATANLKRLEEALRSLEEYGKVHGADFGRAIEALRYRTYTLEKAIVLGGFARRRLADARLYLLAGASRCTASLEWTIKEAVAGGVQIVQLREKKLPDGELIKRARKVRRWTREAGALFIMNDRPDIARLVEADGGVHVGQEELSVKDARRIIGPDALIGVSTHNLEQVRHAIRDGASYIGVGPTFSSATKKIETLAGLEFVRQVAAETSLPAFAIGGISLENAEQVVAAGLRRVAVGHAICKAENPRQVAAQFREILDS